MKINISRSSVNLLYLFLATDLVFIFIHLIYVYTDLLSNPMFSIEKDRGYAELFQYIKEYWIFLLLGILALQKRSLLYLGWSLLFFYLLLDDSIQIHERVGGKISTELGFSSAFNLRAIDFGEMLVSAVVSLFFLFFIGIVYRYSDPIAKRISRYLIIMLLALALFGIVVDMLHIVALDYSSIAPLLAVMEDGGEHLVISLIAWFVFTLPEQLALSINPPRKLHRTLEKVEK